MKSRTACAPWTASRLCTGAAPGSRHARFLGQGVRRRFTLQSYTGHANQSTKSLRRICNRSSCLEKFSIDTWPAARLFGKALARQRRGCYRTKFSSVPPTCRCDRGLQAGCLVSRCASVRRCGPDPFGRKRRASGRSQAALRRRLQRAKRKTIFRKTLTQPNWPTT